MGFLVDLIFFWPFSQACVTEYCAHSGMFERFPPAQVTVSVK